MEIKKLLDDYIKKKENNLNYSKISNITKETRTITNKELKDNHIKKDNTNIIGKSTNKRLVIVLVSFVILLILL